MAATTAFATAFATPTTTTSARSFPVPLYPVQALIYPIEVLLYGV
jgi:hypothetical protein